MSIGISAGSVSGRSVFATTTEERIDTMSGINLELLSSGQRQQRMNIRNFLLTATDEELRRELENTYKYHPNDKDKIIFIQELIDESGF